MSSTNQESSVLIASNKGAVPIPRLLTPQVANDLWFALQAGRTRITASHCGAAMCYLEFLAVPDADSVPLEPVVAETLNRLLCGQAQKVIALEFGCSGSTVTTRAQRAIRQIGLNCAPSNLPVLLVILSQTARGNLQNSQTYLGEYPPGSGRHLLTAPRPDTGTLKALSRAESELVNMMVAAVSRRDMALEREVSGRTIANQLAQVYQKLGVCSRITLMIRVTQLAASFTRTMNAEDEPRLPAAPYVEPHGAFKAPQRAFDC